MLLDRRGFGRRGGLALLLAALGGAGAAGWRADASTDAAPGLCEGRCGGLIAGWNETAEALLAAAGVSEHEAGRMLAMLHLAQHDAVNAALPRSETYLPTGRDGATDPAIAAAAAAHDVLLYLFPSQADRLAAALADSLAEAVTQAEARSGRALGAAAADAILAARAEDGSAAQESHHPAVHLGAWRPTDAAAAVQAPHWAWVRPFAMTSPGQFRPAPPPSVESGLYAGALAEAQGLGGRSSAERSRAETDAAAFWALPPETAWNRIARNVARARGLDLWDAARLFALLNMALADARIAAWNAKLRHDFWRPETAIRMAGVDFNPATHPDTAWTPLLPSPASPAHVSAHATQAAAAAVVLQRLLGDAMPFTLEGRTYRGFASAAREAAESRILAGAQFRFAVEEGLGLGERVGRHVLRSPLQPQERRRTA